MIPGGTSNFGLGVDYGVQLIALALLTLIATKLYPNRQLKAVAADSAMNLA